MRQLIAGNWKMYGLRQSLAEIAALVRALEAAPPVADVLVCPPATLLAASVGVSKGALSLGGQDCHSQPDGPCTGDVSAEMLADAGAQFVIVGHSERRAAHLETSEHVRAKAEAAQRAGLTPIICIGEKLADRDAGTAENIVAAQLDDSLPAGGDYCIAYEPVWAIGTGRTPKNQEIEAIHRLIRNRIGASRRILYGGSVKPENAREILSLADVDGALVGGASLTVSSFLPIIEAAQRRD